MQGTIYNGYLKSRFGDYHKFANFKGCVILEEYKFQGTIRIQKLGTRNQVKY